MLIRRVTHSIFQRQHRRCTEIIFRKLHPAVVYRVQVLGFQLLRSPIGTMTFEAKGVGFGYAQEVLIVAAVRFVAGRAALGKRRLMQVRLLHLLRLFTVAGEASRNRVRLQEARRSSGMRIVAGNAFALRARMLHLGLLDLVRLLAVAGNAEGLGVALGQHDFAVLGGRVTGIAAPARERSMRERLHQLGLRRLVRVVALHAIGGGERLPLMRFDQARVLGIVAIEAQGRRRFGQVIVELDLALLADFVGDVASLTTHVEGGVTAALWGDVEALDVAGEAKILPLIAGCRLQQLKLVVGLMRVVTLNAVAYRWRMNFSLEVGRILIGVAGEAKRLRRGGDQLYAGDILVDADLVATGTTSRDRRMDVFPFGFVRVTLGTLRRVGVLVERYGMDRSDEQACADG